MPELPEVETTLRGVSPHLVGRKVREVIVRHRGLRWPVSETVHELAGEKILSGARRGKYLLFKAKPGTLLIHLGMSGALRISDPETPWRKHDHFALLLDSGKQLRFHDPRRFGCVLLVDEPEKHPLIAPLGPEPLSDEFDAAYLQRAFKGKTANVKQSIMDSHLVVGVGNIYACEALFMAGISPKKAAGKVTRVALIKFVAAIKEVLLASIEMGGTTLRDFLNEKGEPGYFGQTLRVYDREGEPCRVCGTAVKRIVQSNRSTFYCGKCQRG